MVEVYDRAEKARTGDRDFPEFIADLAGVASNVIWLPKYFGNTFHTVPMPQASSKPQADRTWFERASRFAKTPEGHRDRKMKLFEHSGFLPPKTGGELFMSTCQRQRGGPEERDRYFGTGAAASMESDTLRFTRVLKGEAAKVIESETPATAPARSRPIRERTGQGK